VTEVTTAPSWPGRTDSDTLVSAIFERAEADPERMFFRSVDGEVATYRDTARRIFLWANRFRALGVNRGDRVGFMLGANLTSAVAPLGAALVGAWDVPINVGYRRGVLRHVIEDAGIRTLVVTGQSLPTLEELDGLPECLAQIVVVAHGLPLRCRTD